MFYNIAFVLGGIIGVELTKRVDASVTLALMAMLYIVSAIAIEVSNFEAETTATPINASQRRRLSTA